MGPPVANKDLWTAGKRPESDILKRMHVLTFFAEVRDTGDRYMAEAKAVWDGQQLKELGGYTWPGIEFGNPPSFKHSFFEYVDGLRLGNLALFREVEAESGDWWFPTLDRGAGACLHFAVDHGQIECVRFLVEQRNAEVNQQDVARSWTPLMRCAHMCHYTNKPYMQVFEYLLEKGADPELKGFRNSKPSEGEEVGVLDVVVKKEGEVKQRLSELISKHKGVLTKPSYKYNGPPIGPTALAVLEAWEKLPATVPPANWRAPPPAGFQGSQGMRRAAVDPWRPAGQDDGSFFVRQMTDAELAHQSQLAQGVH